MSSPSHKSASRINAAWVKCQAMTKGRAEVLNVAKEINSQSFSELMARVAASKEPVSITGQICIRSLPLLTPEQAAD